MPNEWMYVGLFLIVGALVPAAAIIISMIIAPRKPNSIAEHV
jgi:NADH:ubiquinone oxidoreductase subunit 3 (subunit A)